MQLLLPHNGCDIRRLDRGPQRSRHCRCRRTDDHPWRPCRRHAIADRPRAVEVSRCVADDGQRGMADIDIGRRDRCPWPSGNVRAATDRPRLASALPPSDGGPGSFRARPLDRHPAIVVAAGPRPGRRQDQPSVADIELPRQPSAARARSTAAGRVAVPRRGADSRRRRDGRAGSRRPSRGSAR